MTRCCRSFYLALKLFGFNLFPCVQLMCCLSCILPVPFHFRLASIPVRGSVGVLDPSCIAWLLVMSC